MKRQIKRPAFQFYPKEWIWDLGLRQCSIAARGLWVDLLCMMHESEPYGRLTHPVNLVLQVTGLTQEVFNTLISDLETHEVFSREVDGTIYSRRMVRDEDRRNSSVVNGGLGGNPMLVKGEVNPRKCKPGLTSPEEEEKRRSKEVKSSLLMTKWGKFKQLYPARRLDEENACRAFLSRDDEIDAILSGLRVAVTSEDWMKDGGKFAPMASRFISEGRYKDAARATPPPARRPPPFDPRTITG